MIPRHAKFWFFRFETNFPTSFCVLFFCVSFFRENVSRVTLHVLYWALCILSLIYCPVCHVVNFVIKKNFKNFMVPFYGWNSTALRLEPLQGGSLLFTTKFPEIPGTHFINLGRMNGWVDLGATQRFWTQDLWIWNPAT